MCLCRSHLSLEMCSIVSNCWKTFSESLQSHVPGDSGACTLLYGMIKTWQWYLYSTLSCQSITARCPSYDDTDSAYKHAVQGTNAKHTVQLPASSRHTQHLQRSNEIEDFGLKNGSFKKGGGIWSAFPLLFRRKFFALLVRYKKYDY